MLMKFGDKKIYIYIGLLAAVIAGVGVGVASTRRSSVDHGQLPPGNTQTAQAPEQLKETVPPASKAWVCPMHSHIVEDHPGRCPICGMDLVPIEEPSGPERPGFQSGVHVDSATQQRLGVRLAEVARHPLRRELRTYGVVGIDESSIVNISPKIEGWIRKLHVTAVGQSVRAGQVVYELYSPELVQRQREYIELLWRRDQLLQSMTVLAGQNAQAAASLARERFRVREKFVYADVGEDVLSELEKSRRTVDVVPVRASRSGFVTQIGAREGSFVTPMINLLSLADTANVWVDVALYTDQLAWVREGDEATVRSPYPGQPDIEGRLNFVTPALDGTTQTRRARMVVKNDQERLRPGQFVDVVIMTPPREALAIPRSAVIRTGAGVRVMLAGDGGHFEPVPIETGIENDELIEVLGGLSAGSRVAVNGQFLLDAAASMSDTVQRMQHAH